MTRRELQTRIRAVLETSCASRCMDSPRDVQAAVAVLSSALHASRCADCDHLDEVHVATGDEHVGCLGGPETHCDCQGFREEES